MSYCWLNGVAMARFRANILADPCISLTLERDSSFV